MNEEELNINEIDMECSCADDDDSFGNISVCNCRPKTFKGEDDNESEERLVKSHTGVTLDFSDDDEPKKFDDEPVKVITADISPEDNLSIKGTHNDEYSGYNEIDMECNSCEDDDDFGYVPAKNNKNSDILDFGDDDEDKELIDEEMIEEKKTTQGEVEKDYWDKVQKKHAKTNVKGSYNWQFHLKDAQSQPDSTASTGSVAGIGAADGSVGAVGTASGGPAAGGAGGGVGESLEDVKQPECDSNKLGKDILTITGFTLVKQPDGSYILKDKYNISKDMTCKNNNDILNCLAPYISDAFICPLQVITGENFNDCDEWCNWYTDENAKKYPQCADDIKYCDFIAHHFNECKF